MSSPHALTHAHPDVVSSDFDALALHMRHCALAQGRWFAVKSDLQRVRSLAAGRIVTIAACAAVVAIGFLAIA